MKFLDYCISDKKDYKEETTMNAEEQKSEFNFHNNPIGVGMIVFISQMEKPNLKFGKL